MRPVVRGVECCAMLTLTIALALTAQATLSKDEQCAHIGDVAEAIMVKRQSNEPLSKVLALFDDDPAKDLMRAIVIRAYDAPGFQTPSLQRQEAASFRNYWETLCHRSKG